MRRDAADMILSNMREHSSDLVQQAVMVSEELIRVAILWHEQWHETLEDASRYRQTIMTVCLLGEVFDFHNYTVSTCSLYVHSHVHYMYGFCWVFMCICM